jgi:hypothetical protein
MLYMRFPGTSIYVCWALHARRGPAAGRAVDVRARGPDGLATYWLGSPSRSTYRLAPQRSLSHVDL